MAIAYNGGVTDATKIGTTSTGALRFIPTLWAAKINKAFYAATVFHDITNNDYSGEISNLGDKVVIANSPTITIGDYTIGTALTYERPPVTTTELLIDKAKHFAIKVNDVEQKQAKPNYVSEFSDAASSQLKVAIDKTVFDGTYNDAQAANKGVAAGAKSGQINLGAAGGTNGSNALTIVPTATSGSDINVFDALTRLSATLDEANVPETERWLTISPTLRQKLIQSGHALALIQGGNESQYRNGKIGMLDRFTVYVTNQLKQVTEGTAQLEYIMAGHKSAMCFASQIAKVETLQDPDDFGSLMRGLNVYGFKTVRPAALATAVVKY